MIVGIRKSLAFQLPNFIIRYRPDLFSESLRTQVRDIYEQADRELTKKMRLENRWTILQAEKEIDALLELKVVEELLKIGVLLLQGNDEIIINPKFVLDTAEDPNIAQERLS